MYNDLDLLNFTHFRELGQKYKNIFVQFLVEMKTLDFAFEIILLSPCPCWIRFCPLIFFQKFPNFFGGKNLYQSGYFDTQPSPLSPIKVVPWRL
jgi:hypothetical protein